MPASRQPRKMTRMTTTEAMAMPRCMTSSFTAASALAPSLRVTATSTPAGMACFFRSSSLASTASATTTALVPAFLAMARVTAGCSPVVFLPAAGP